MGFKIERGCAPINIRPARLSGARRFSFRAGARSAILVLSLAIKWCVRRVFILESVDVLNRLRRRRAKSSNVSSLPPPQRTSSTPASVSRPCTFELLALHPPRYGPKRQQTLASHMIFGVRQKKMLPATSAKSTPAFHGERSVGIRRFADPRRERSI